MNPYLEITRPNVCVLAILGFIVGALIVGAQFSTFFFFAILAVFLICAAGNVINDYYDIEIDKINASQRPLPSGRMKRQNALYLSLCLYLIGLASSSFVGPAFLGAAIFNSFLSYMYASTFKKMPIFSNIVVSFLATSVYVAASFVSGFSISTKVAILALMSFSGMMAREIIKDVEDLKGDRKGGAIKLPSVIGERNAVIVSRAFSIIAVATVPLPYLLGYVTLPYLALAVPGALLVLAKMLKTPTEAKKGLKIGMFLVLLGYIAGLF